MKKLLALLLAALMLATPTVSTLANTTVAPVTNAEAELHNIIDYYRANPVLTSWWEAAALKAAGGHIRRTLHAARDEV